MTHRFERTPNREHPLRRAGLYDAEDNLRAEAVVERFIYALWIGAFILAAIGVIGGAALVLKAARNSAATIGQIEAEK